MTSKHPWTYKIILEYHACKRCGYIIESRMDYQPKNGEFVKVLVCPRCQHQFVERKKTPGTPKRY